MGDLLALKKEIIKKYGTPCAVVDLNVLEENISRVQKLCDNAGVSNRPHIKTHKSGKIARMQLNAGASGVTCQKLGEAEVMASAGVKDILIATNVLGAAASGALAALQKQISLKVCADNTYSIKAYSDAARDAGRVLDVLVECDTGQKRAGVETPEEAFRLAKLIEDDSYLNFKGLLYYPTKDNWNEAEVFHVKLLKFLSQINLIPEIVSTGGTPNLQSLGKLSEATEHRAGTCVFNDLMMVNDGFATIDDCALRVYTSVVSRAGKDRGILDAGSKTLTSDLGGLTGYGSILEYPNAIIDKLAEEHGFLNLINCAVQPEVGEIVRVIPNHVCVVVNMFNELVLVRDSKIIDVTKVDARGLLV